MIKLLIRLIVFVWSFLPWKLLYIKSSAFYVFVYYILGYRKKVVFENIKNSFPDKSEQERKKIMKDFYKHFCDLLFEAIKMASMSKEDFELRCRFTENAKSVFNELSSRKQTNISVLGHCGNWEWNALSYQCQFKQDLLGVYHKLSNEGVGDLLYKWRTKFGAKIISLEKFYRFLIEHKNEGFTIGLIADQSAPPETSYWTPFLNQDTAVFNGPEKLALKNKYPLYYIDVSKEKRGMYVLDIVQLWDGEEIVDRGELTKRHVLALESNIKRQPEIWLWSHRRWKHKRPLL
ncbi:MAG: lysophospholipid acyltransferase family protein [Bacteroidia bacterium]